MAQRTYVLVHEIGFGVWEWEKVRKGLKERGHSAVALDLRASGEDRTEILNVKDLNNYAQPLLDYVASLNNKVILVAHGYGGVSAKLAAKKYPDNVSSIVYVNAFMLDKSGSPNYNLCQFFQLFHDWKDTTIRPRRAGNVFQFGPEFIKATLCNSATPEDQEKVIDKVRPGIFFLENPVFPSPSVHECALVCTEDKFLTRSFQQGEAEEIKIKVVLIEGADHLPMISQPDNLCDYIIKHGA